MSGVLVTAAARISMDDPHPHPHILQLGRIWAATIEPSVPLQNSEQDNLRAVAGMAGTDFARAESAGSMWERLIGASRGECGEG
jgi:hypothetical protein